MRKVVYIAGILIVFVLLIQGVHCSKTQDYPGIHKESEGNRGRRSENTHQEDSRQQRAYQEENSDEPGQEQEANTSSGEVLICKSKSSYAYHSHVCQGLKRCKSGTASMSEKEAREAGKKACKYCY